MKKQSMPVALSVDVEDGINIAMRDVFGKEMSPTERVVINTKKILELFSEHEVKGTFFILGQVAEHYPKLIRKIHDHGHEIGVHGYDHYKFQTMSRDEAHDQLKRAKSILEDLTGEEVRGHRAPAFSINESTKWALPLMAELGFTYDSSVMPCKAASYGWEGFPQDITELKFENDKSIYEIPMSTLSVGFRDLPCLGGSYFRLLPYWLTSYAIRKIADQRNPIFYMHPYEIDTDRYPDFYFEALKQDPITTQLKMRSMWLMRKTVSDKIEKMISAYKTDTIGSILKNAKEINNISRIDLMT